MDDLLQLFKDLSVGIQVSIIGILATLIVAALTFVKDDFKQHKKIFYILGILVFLTIVGITYNSLSIKQQPPPTPPPPVGSAGASGTTGTTGQDVGPEDDDTPAEPIDPDNEEEKYSPPKVVYLNNLVKNTSHAQEMGILVLTNNSFNKQLAMELSNLFMEKGYKPVTNLFTSSFLSSGMADNLLYGDAELMRELNLIQAIDFLLICKTDEDTYNNTSRGFANTHRVNFNGAIFNVKTGMHIRNFNFVAKGPGASSFSAKSNAYAKLKTFISDELN